MGVSFPQHGLIMSSVFYSTYNVVKLPTHVCVLVSEVLQACSFIYWVCALIYSMVYAIAASRSHNKSKHDIGYKTLEVKLVWKDQ